jgi:predicted ATPase
MPITQITVNNFKGIGSKVQVPVHPITLLFGANSAGKSTILQALLYLSELLERQNADADRLLISGAAIDLGGFQQLVYQHDLARVVTVGVKVKADADGLPVYPVSYSWSDRGEAAKDFSENGLPNIEEVEVEVSVQWDAMLHRPFISTYRVGINGHQFAEITADSEKQAYLTACDYGHPALMDHFEATDKEGDALPPECEVIKATMDSISLSGGTPIRVPVASAVIPRWGKLLLADPNWSPTDRSFKLAGSSRLDQDEDLANFYFTQFVLSHLIVGAGETVLDQLKKIRYIGPLREVPDRTFGAVRSPAADRWANGAAAWDLLYASASASLEGLLNELTPSAPNSGQVDNTKFLKEILLTGVNHYLAPERLNLGYRLEARHVYEVPRDGFALKVLKAMAFAPEDIDTEERLRLIISDIERQPEHFRLALIDEARKTSVAPCDIGVGIAQVIPIVVATLASESNLTAIEQPELHLHPAVQCALADVFVREVNFGVDRTFLIETHSEHFLLRLLKRVRQTSTGNLPNSDLSLTTDELSVLVVETYQDRSVFREMPVNERGEFVKAWPGGFFEEDLEELF